MGSDRRTLTTELLEPILARDPAGPRITWYDDANGARIELSGLTLANWAAKTANMIRDEFGLVAGARVGVLLPAHWQSAGVLLGAWWAGTEVVLDADADLVFAAAADLPDADEVVALSLDPMGLPARNLPVGVTDYASSVRIHGDRFGPAGAGSALAGMSVADVLDAAKSSLTPADRVLSALEWDSPQALIDRFVAVLAAGASLVQVSNAAGVDHSSERITQTLRA